MAKQKKYFLVFLLSSILLLVFLYYWHANPTLMGWLNITFSTGIIFVGFAWLIFATNYGVFDIAVYGTKKLWLVIFNKHHNYAKTYYDYHLSREKVNKFVYLEMGAIGLFYILVSLVLMGFYYNIF